MHLQYTTTSPMLQKRLGVAGERQEQSLWVRCAPGEAQSLRPASGEARLEGGDEGLQEAIGLLTIHHPVIDGQRDVASRANHYAIL